MPILTKAQLEALNQSSFADNTSGAITPEILRTYNTATIDTLVDSLDTGSYTTDSEFNAFTSSVDAKFTTIGSQSGSWGGGGTINTSSLATTGSNIFTGDQTIQSDGTLNGIFYKTGSSEFFVGQRSNGNFSISSSAESRILDINPSSGWLEVYAPVTNFNNGVNLRGTTNVRNVTTDTGNGYVAQFDGFTASLQEGYAWVGKNGGTSVSVPTSSFGGGGGTIVGYATTGSNTFTGSQFINGGNKLYIQRDTAGAQQFLRLGATDNTFNFAFVVTGSDNNPGQQVWGINNAGGIWGNSFDAGVVLNNYVTASSGITITNGTFSAPLQQGYVWAGDSNGRTQAIPTSSFGGGGTIVGYATTGSNTFVGDQIISNNSTLNVAGQIIGNTGIGVYNQFGNINIAANAQGSGSQYPGFSVAVDTVAYPTDIYGGFSLNDGTNQTLGSFVINTYTPQYGGTPVVVLLGGGNNPDSNNTAIAFPSNGEMDVWKQSNFKYGINITGSALVNGNSVVTSNQTGSLVNVPLTSLNSFTQSQQVLNATYATTGSNSFKSNQQITGSLGVSSNTNLNGGLFVSGGNIVVQDNDITTNRNLTVGQNTTMYGSLGVYGGGITLAANPQGSGSAYGGLNSTVDITTDPSNVFNAIGIYSPTGQNFTLAMNSYSPQYGGVATPTIIGWYNNASGSDTAIGFPSNGNMDVWKKSNFAYGVDVTGSLTITSGSNFYAHGHKQFNVGAFQSNISQSGSANVSQSMQFEVTDISNGVTIASNSRITITNAGTYNIQFSAQLLANTGADDVWIWLKKNGTNVSASAGKVTLANNEELIAAWNYVVEAANNDYFELAWQSLNGDAIILQEPASGNVPSIPSIILTVTQVR